MPTPPGTGVEDGTRGDVPILHTGNTEVCHTLCQLKLQDRE